MSSPPLAWHPGDRIRTSAGVLSVTLVTGDWIHAEDADGKLSVIHRDRARLPPESPVPDPLTVALAHVRAALEEVQHVAEFDGVWDVNRDLLHSLTALYREERRRAQ